MKEKIRNNHVGAQRLEGIPETRDTTVPFSRGITLISLIITIIILLILAGVTISFVMGNNGIFKFAQIAKENYENATEKEQYDLAQVDDYIEHARDTVRTTETILWEGTANQKTTYLFKDSSYDVDNYDRIIIEFSQNGVAKSSISLSKGFIKKNTIEDIRLQGYSTRYTDIHFIDNGFVVDIIKSEQSPCFIYANRIIGVKY